MKKSSLLLALAGSVAAGLMVWLSESCTSHAYATAGSAEQIAENPAIDPDRIYIAGQGSGGIVASYLVAKNPGRFAALMCVDSHWPGSKSASLKGLPKSKCQVTQFMVSYTPSTMLPKVRDISPLTPVPTA